MSDLVIRPDDIGTPDVSIKVNVTGGTDGATFTPAVSDEGVLSWSNNAGLENPEPVDVKGPKGDPGVSSWNDLTDKPFDMEYTDAYVLSESTYTTDGTVNISSPLENKIVAGKTYSVSWNGTVYDLVAGNFDLDGVTMIGLGDFGVLIEGESTGEPFTFVQIPDDLVLALGAYAMIMPLDGSTAFTISIYGPTVTYRTIDPNYLPPSDNCNLVNGTGMYSIKSTAAAAAAGTGSCAFGIGTSAAHDGGHAEGYRSRANGDYSHAEGENTVAAGRSTHAEGWGTEANASFSHAEGNLCKTGIYGEASHAEGYSTEASASAAHAEGYATKARGTYSHAEGYYTLASGYAQHAQGKFNIEDMNGKYLHIVGNGESNSARSNAHTLDWDGNAWFAGTIYLGGTGQDDTAAVKLDDYINSLIDAKLAAIPNAEEASF